MESVIPKEKINMLATAFGKLKQNVLWRLKGDQVTILARDRENGFFIDLLTD